jgi:hypothetical protein
MLVVHHAALQIPVFVPKGLSVSPRNLPHISCLWVSGRDYILWSRGPVYH